MIDGKIVHGAPIMNRCESLAVNSEREAALSHRNHCSIRDPASDRDDQLMVAGGKPLGYLDVGLSQTHKTRRHHQRKNFRFNASDRCTDIRSGET